MDIINLLYQIYFKYLNMSKRLDISRFVLDLKEISEINKLI